MALTMIFWLNLAATFYLTGLIWFVQVVHYPLFDGVGPSTFANYEARHTRLTSLVVIGPMIVELGTAVWLLVAPPTHMAHPMAAVLLALVLMCWASTFFLQVPLHSRLSGGFDAKAHGRLVTTNWIRTLGWTTRAVLLMWLVSRLPQAV